MEKREEIILFFKKSDPKMSLLLSDIKVDLLKKNDNYKEYYIKLCHEILGQQLSGKAAGAIIERFNTLCGSKIPKAEDVLKIDDQKLRDVGMAWSKVRAIKDLASKTVSKELRFEQYPNMSDEDIQENLIQVKGIGPWTTEMFLMFTLGREDIFSVKDLGLRKGICNIYGLDRKEKGIDEKILKISDRWSPYRSYCSLALWKSLELDGWWRK